MQFLRCVWTYITHDNIIAAATVAIGFFTYYLVKVSNRQAALTQESIELARKEFISTHRPKIRLRRMRPILPLKPEERVGALIEAANIGDTTATIFEIGVDIYVMGQPLNARPNPVDALPVAPGKQADINVIGQRLTQSQLNNVSAGKIELRMLGIINYRDDNGTIRTTSFARRYDTRLCRFAEIPADDPEKDRDYEN